MKIEFVTDLMCPWSAMLYPALDQVIHKLRTEHELSFIITACQLIPDVQDGANLQQYVQSKYALDAEQAAASLLKVASTAANYGVSFDGRSKLFDTSKANNLLRWIALNDVAAQSGLYGALSAAYFSQGENIGSAEVIVQCSIQAGLSDSVVQQVLDMNLASQEIQNLEEYYKAHLQGTPAIIVNDTSVIYGVHSADVLHEHIKARLTV